MKTILKPGLGILALVLGITACSTVPYLSQPAAKPVSKAPVTDRAARRQPTYPAQPPQPRKRTWDGYPRRTRSCPGNIPPPIRPRRMDMTLAPRRRGLIRQIRVAGISNHRIRHPRAKVIVRRPIHRAPPRRIRHRPGPRRVRCRNRNRRWCRRRRARSHQ
jgi:hypothetical protein